MTNRPAVSLHAHIRATLGWRRAAATASIFAAAALSPAAFAQAADSKTDSGDLAEVVVTGRRAALENATARKRVSESIIDSVVADEAGMLPDNSITEVLQRVAGVTVVRFASLGDPDHFSAEGSGVQVRGLSGVAGRLNGREVFSASGGRGLSWGDVTPELMSAVDVYKASTADLIEGGTGGQIDLRTKMPFDFAEGFKLNASANLNYGDLSEETQPGASGLITNTWDVGDGRFGALLDVAYNKYSSNADFFRMEPFYRTRVGAEDKFVPGGFDFGNDHFERKRQGIYLGLQWAPTDNLTLSQTTFYSKYDTNNSGNGIFATSQSLGVNAATSTFDSDGFLVKSTNVFQRGNSVAGNFQPNNSNISAGGNSSISNSQSITRDLSLGLEWNVSERLGIKGAVQSVDSTSNRYGFDAFPLIQFPTAFAIDLSGDLPQVSLPSGANRLTDPASTVWQATMDNRQENEGELFAANLDFDFKISEDGFFRSLGFGARYGDRSEVDWNSGYNWAGLTDWGGSPTFQPFTNARPGDTEIVDWNNFFRGDANLPGPVLMPSMAMVARFDPRGTYALYSGGNHTGTGAFEPFTFNPSDKTESSTQTTAIYLLTKFDGGEHKFLGMSFKGNVGARAVRTENESAGSFQQGSGARFLRNGVVVQLANGYQDVSGGSSDTRLLPSVNFTFSPSETMQLRLAHNLTLDQPSFWALRAQGNLGVTTRPYNISTDPPLPPGTTVAPAVFQGFTSTAGNPLLKPVISHNSDLSFEWYPERSASAHVSLFHKTIDNWILATGTSQIQVPASVTYILPTPETRVETATASVLVNSAEKATIKGVEFGGRVFFDRLPSFWSGIGFEANYTYIDSKNPGEVYFDIDGIRHDDAPIQGLSKNNFNLTAMYEKGPLSMRLAWSWRSKYLQSTDSNGTNGAYDYYSAPGVFRNANIALPIYGDAYGQLDFGTTWRPNETVSLSLEFNNLTNEITRTLQGGYPGGSNIRSWFVSDRRANLAVRYNFK